MNFKSLKLLFLTGRLGDCQNSMCTFSMKSSNIVVVVGAYTYYI